MKKQILFFCIIFCSTIILATISLIGSQSFAAITNVGVSGAYSNLVIINTTPATTTGSTTPVVTTASYDVYGGVGDGVPCNAGVSTTCNTCTDTTYNTVAGVANKACNPMAIGVGSTFTVTFTSTAAGNAILSDTAGTQINTGLVANTVGQPVTITVNWGQICSAMGSTDCITGLPATGYITLDLAISNGTVTLLDSQQITFHVGLIQSIANSTNGGISDFTIFPGDEKAYIQSSIQAFNNNFTTPTGSTVGIKSLAVFNTLSSCPLGTEADAMINSLPYTPFDIAADGTLSDNRVMGLVNGTEYLFKIGMQDLAGNIGLFSTAASPGPTSAGGASCKRFYQTSIPQKVYGLLNDGQNCFIATAAYGSNMDARVQTFRDFRDQFLLKSSLGKKFVSFYYRNSPPLAHFIADDPSLRAIARAGLYPLLGVAWLYTNLGAIPANLIFTFGILGIFFLIVYLRRNSHRAGL